MKGGDFSAPGDYIHFKSQVPLHNIPVGLKQWRYYDFGPKVVPPLICLPGTAGTADVFYKQIMALSIKGYRVIAVDIPRVWNHQEWVQAFEKFLNTIDVHHIHLYGTALGGFLAQIFAQHRPRRVKSLVLSNTFLDTRTFSSAMPWSPMLIVLIAYLEGADALAFFGECIIPIPSSVHWTPSFLLKRYVLTGISNGPHEPFISDSVDFVVSQVETLKKDDLASRLTLTVDAASVGQLLISDSFVTLIDTNDYSAIPQELKDQVSERYPSARRAYLKTGGDFPFLSRPDEVNLHLQLHMRRVGVEARPDLVQGASEDIASDSSSSKQNARQEGFNNPQNGDSDGPRNPDSNDPQTENTDDSMTPSAENQSSILSEITVIQETSDPLTEAKPPIAIACDCLMPVTSHANFRKGQSTCE